MLHYYLKIAIRNFRKTIFASLINVLGLSAGFASVFFIAVWVQHELNYDRFHHNAEDIYLLASRDESEADFEEYSPLANPRPDLFERYPEVKANVSVVPLDKAGVSYGETSFLVNGLAVTRSFFETFNFPFVAGTYEPYSDSMKVIYLTEGLAYKMFNSHDIVGKVVEFDFDSSGFMIGGILEDPPANSSIKFEFLVPYFAKAHWGKRGFIYLALSANTDLPSFKRKIVDIGKHSPYYSGFNVEVKTTESTVIPITDIYFHSSFSRFDHGNILYVWIVMVAGLVILFVTIANHINLTSSQIAARFTELSIRKIIGSEKMDLYKQFMLESFFLISISLFTTAILSTVLANDFYSIVEKNIPLTEIFSGWGMLLLPAVLLVSLLSCVALAGFFNAIKPLTLLKSKSPGSLKLSSFKDKFMIIQLIVAFAGIAVTIGLDAQLDHMVSKDPGYQMENIVKVDLTASNFLERSKDEREKLTDYIDGQLNNSTLILDYDRGKFPTDVLNFPWKLNPATDADNVAMLTVGSRFFELFGLEMAEGKVVDRYGNFAVLNESAVRYYGISDPVGYKISNSNWGEFEICGVVRDFNFESSGLAVKPLVIVCLPYPERPVIAKIAAGRTREALEFLRNIHATVNPGLQFSYQFFDDEFDKIYKRDLILTKVFNIVSVVAAVISMLGMFSVILIFTREKTKEIGIRKVFGAQVRQITRLIGFHFVKRLFLAFVVATPVSWFALHKWLENFTYKIELSWWIFAVSGVIVFVLAMLTIGFQTLRAARANPVESLRYD